MLAALDQLETDVLNGTYVAAESDEDVHGSLERGLLERAGANWAASFVLDARAMTNRYDGAHVSARPCPRDCFTLVGSRGRLVAQAEAHPYAPMPGRTHLQHAQPVLLSHHYWHTAGLYCVTFNAF